MVTNDEFKYYHYQSQVPGSDIEIWYAERAEEVWMVDRQGKSYTIARRNSIAYRESLLPATEKDVAAMFHKAIQQWINLMPEALRPAGMTTATCKCGCGQPPATKSDYATSACRVRFFRKEKRAGAQKVTPQETDARVAADVVAAYRDWFDLTYRPWSEPGKWLITRRVNNGGMSATKRGFIDLNGKLIVDGCDVYDACIQMAECIKEIDYFDVEHPKVVWNIMQHFCFFPDPALVKEVPLSVALWKGEIDGRLNKAARLLERKGKAVDPDELLEILMPSTKPKVTPKAKEKAVADDNKQRIERIAKRILKALRAGCPNDIVSLDRNCARWGVTPSYGRDIRAAYTLVQADGRLDKALALLNPPKVTPETTVDPVVTEIEGVLMQVFNRFEQPNMTTFRNALSSRGFDVGTKEGKSNIEKAIENLIVEGLIKRKGLQFIQAK